MDTFGDPYRYSKGLIKLVVLPNIGIGLEPCQKIPKSDIQSQFSRSKIICIVLTFF